MKIRYVNLAIGALLLAIATLTPKSVSAHQPFCEVNDVTAQSPWQVPDAGISYAYYANLYPAGDVDYFTFDAVEGQSVLLSMSIPAIEGQEDFAPLMALIGPGVEAESQVRLPEGVSIPKGQGAMNVSLGEEPEYWYEPFGGRYYWNWENSYFVAPEDASYTVVLWHPEGELGRYSFVVGEEEIRGGDPECMASFDTYWTPLIAGESPYQEAVAATDVHMHADGAAHEHGKILEVTSDRVPLVDLQLFPLDDGTYNVRIQTLNFTFAPHHVGMDAVDGEGHAHLYIDDVKIARIYGEWFHLDTLPEDAGRISVGLYANNHQPLAVEGEPIMGMVMLTDALASMTAAD